MGIQDAEWRLPEVDIDRASCWKFGLFFCGFISPVIAIAANSSFGLVVFFIFLAIAQAVDMRVASLAQRFLKKRRESIVDEDAVSATVTVMRRDEMVGQDEGMFWVEGDLLRFEGLRTEFALVRAWMKNPGEWKDIKRKRTVDMVVDDGQHESVTLSLSSINKIRYPDHFFDREEFVERFHQWRMSDPVAGEGAVFPPTSIAPDRFLGKRARSIGSILLPLAGVLHLVIAGLGFGFEGFLGAQIGVGIFGLVLIGLGIFFRSVGTRSRRHLKTLFPEDPYFA